MSNEHIDLSNISAIRVTSESSSLGSDPYQDKNTTEKKYLPLEKIGAIAEEQKITHRKWVLIFLCSIIFLTLTFVFSLTVLMALVKTNISDNVYKYLITGVFVNLLMLFKGITNYLYNNQNNGIINKLLDKTNKNK